MARSFGVDEGLVCEGLVLSESLQYNGGSAPPESDVDRIDHGLFIQGSSVLNRYEKLGVIGRGPRATLYRGHAEGLSQERAIKELHREWLNNRHERDMFFHEAKVWASLKNQHLITIHDVVFEKGWLIFELLRPIQTGFSQHAEADSIRRFLRQSCEALDEMHGSGHLHANLKPTNVLYSEKGGVVLADGRCVPLSQTQQLPAHRGSAKFLAPEMCESRLEQVGPSSDLYSLAFVLLDIVLQKDLDAFAMKSQLSDQMRDEEDFETAWWRWHASRSEKLDPLHTLRPDLPRRLTDILDRLTCKEISQRFPSATDVLAELAEEQSSSAGTARDVPIVAEFVTAAATVDMATRVIDRPDAPIIIRIASGPRAGEMVGLSKSEFTICADPDSDLPLSPRDYPHLKNSRLQFRREVDGWTLTCAELARFWINQTPVEVTQGLKSGDIIRATPLGPDLQFIVHNVGLPSISAVAMKFAPRLFDSVAKSDQVAPHAPAPPAPPRGNVAPLGKVAPGRSNASSPAARPPAATHAVAPAPPMPPATATTDHAPRPPAASMAAVAPRPPAHPPGNSIQGNFWRQLLRGNQGGSKEGRDAPKSNNQNLYVAIISIAVMGLVVFLWPTGESPPTESPTTGAAAAEGDTPPTAARPEEPIEPTTEALDSTLPNN